MPFDFVVELYSCIDNKANFKKRGLKKRVALHEFYHHLVDANCLEFPDRIEEIEADIYASEHVFPRCEDLTYQKGRLSLGSQKLIVILWIEFLPQALHPS
jgi:hypothetical protein